MALTQAKREAVVKSALPDDVLLFDSMRGTEALGRLYEFTVSMLSTDSEVKVADVLGKPMTVIVTTSDGNAKRYFHGIVTHFRYTGTQGDYSAYEAIVHPGLWLLTRSSNCRIFQEMSVPDIVKEVCQLYGSNITLELDLHEAHAPLPYCVQYRETDFDFVCRLLDQAGIYFYFSHTAQRENTVLVDSYGGHRPIDGYGKLTFRPPSSSGGVVDETVQSWRLGGQVTATSYTTTDYDFERAASGSRGLMASSSIPAAYEQTSYEVYAFPGKHKSAPDGDALARQEAERLHGEGERVDAVTTARGLYPGGLFTLNEHPRADQNRSYLVTSASYDVRSNAYSSGGEAFSFQCALTAIGKEHAFRPLAHTPRPVMHGPQTALVVGKAGEEIWTDKYGRIKVQFHWDRDGKADENSSCWVRVAQGWAGKGWGAMAVPRIGMEVVVSFLDGDPDRPLVTGCVYNSDTMPPYALPDEQTISTVKSQSSKGGEGFNELRFEDKKGEEEVYMHAERDFLRVVKNDDVLKVGFETADKGDQTIDIKNDQALTVGHDQVEKIGNNHTLSVKTDQKIDVGGKQAVKAGSTIVIEAGTSIELKVGASSIKIEAAKITIKSAEIDIAADANAKVKAGAMMELKAGAVLTIGGALVQIN